MTTKATLTDIDDAVSNAAGDAGARSTPRWSTTLVVTVVKLRARRGPARLGYQRPEFTPRCARGPRNYLPGIDLR